MTKLSLVGLVLLSGVGCQGNTLIGGTDAGCGATFPKTGFFGPNILYPGNDSFVSEWAATKYELVAKHQATETVIVTMTLLSDQGGWSPGGSANDWRFTPFGSVPDGGVAPSQTFEAPNVTGEFEESIVFTGTGRAQLDLFTCGSTSPSSSKIITWSPLDGGVAFDGGTPLDGGPVSDGGAVFDGGRPRDGGPVFDGGRALDGGRAPDGGRGLDGGRVLDGGGVPDGAPVFGRD
jgi:hypothetical protein